MKKLENEGRKERGTPIDTNSLVAINLLFPDGITIDAKIGAIEMQKTTSEDSIKALNEQMWNEYERGITSKDFAMAVEQIRKLEQIAEANGIVGETKARIYLTKSRLVYFRDKKADMQSAEAYRIAMEGLEYAEEPGTKVSLYNVASDTMAELVGDYERGVELADASCEIAKTGSDVDLGKAENNAALRHLNAAKQFVDSGKEEEAKEAYFNAITHFQNAMDAHANARNSRQLGHAHNNMILCYQGLSGLVEDFHRIEMCNAALEQAELAKKAYGDSPENALHAISANYRKGQTFELEAQIIGLPRYLFNAIQCYTENAIKSVDLEKWGKAKQELDNIQKVVLKQIESDTQKEYEHDTDERTIAQR